MGGVDLLGFHFSRTGLTVAKATIEKFVERATRLYEQEPGEADASARLGLYVQRWVTWATAGLGGCNGQVAMPVRAQLLRA